MTGAERYFADQLRDPDYALAYVEARARICPTCLGPKEPIFPDCDACGAIRRRTPCKPWMASVKATKDEL